MRMGAGVWDAGIRGVGMVNKVLGRMEALKGFIQIPVKGRRELIGDLPTSCKTLVNGEFKHLNPSDCIRK